MLLKLMNVVFVCFWLVLVDFVFELSFYFILFLLVGDLDVSQWTWILFTDFSYEPMYGIREHPGETAYSDEPLSFEMPRKRSQCWICFKYVENDRSLKRHFTENHEKNLNKFQCPKCPRSYVHKKHMNYHLKHECGVEPKFKCGFCDHRSKHKYALVLHMRRHHSKK